MEDMREPFEEEAVRLGRPDTRPDLSRVTEQQLAGVGQGNRATAGRSLDQPGADDALERGDLLADRGLRVAELVRGAPERPLVGDRLERGEVAELEARPAVRSHRHTGYPRSL